LGEILGSSLKNRGGGVIIAGQESSFGIILANKIIFDLAKSFLPKHFQLRGK
jgi:hypothetical protein